MKLRKFITVVLALLVCVGFVGCKGCKKDDSEGNENKYSISYDLNGGEWDANQKAPSSYVSGQSTSLPAPTKQYFEFSGWDLNGEDVKVIPSSSSGDVKVTAIWKAINNTVNFVDGGDQTSIKYEQHAGLTLPTATKEGYTFAGWYIDEALTTQIDKIPVGSNDITVYGKWDKVAVLHEITYVLDGGANPDDAPAKFDEATGLTTLPKPTKEGFVFAGWYSDQACTTVVRSIAAGTKADVVLYAKWEEASAVYNIAYELDGGVNPAEAPTYYTAAEGIQTLPTPTKAGYAFAGWFAEETLTTAVTSIAAGNTGDVTLYAKWTSNATHTITYELDGGTLPAEAPTEYIEGLGIQELPVPTKEGYDFLGWFIGDDKQESIGADATSDITLTAHWDIESKVVYYTITYICDGGTLPADAPTQYQGGVGVELPEPTPNDPTKPFIGWYDESGSSIEKITATAYRDYVLTAKFGAPKIYEPRWELNQIGFDGQGMTYEIKVLPVSEYDPFNVDYSGSQKNIKQKHQTLVEGAYNIVVKYSNWEDAAPWGPERVKYINKKYLAEDFGDVYVVTITSQWIPTLVKGNSIAELYDMNTDEGIFKQLSYDVDERLNNDNYDDDEIEGYIQDETINQASSVKGKVYGYETGVARPDYFMYYNVNLVKECNLEDPAELWLKGEWTLSTFDSWIRNAQNVLSAKGGYALDMGFAESTIGFTASTGNVLTKVKPPVLYINKADVTDNIAMLQEYYADGLYYGRGVQDVSPGFAGGTTLLHHGDLWFMKNSERFNPTKMSFVIGVVPYPTADGEGGIPVLTNDVDEAIEISEGQYLTDASGSYIKSVDMSNSSFQVPFGGTGCYAVLNEENGKNNINSTVIMHILNDLHAGLGPDPNAMVNLTAEESYRNFLDTKFDRLIDIEVIMSCQGKTYFEIMELLSMTVGGGSHFGDGAWWPLAASIIKGSDSPVTAINEVLNKYKQAMRDLGYNIK